MSFLSQTPSKLHFWLNRGSQNFLFKLFVSFKTKFPHGNIAQASYRTSSVEPPQCLYTIVYKVSLVAEPDEANTITKRHFLKRICYGKDDFLEGAVNGSPEGMR